MKNFDFVWYRRDEHFQAFWKDMIVTKNGTPLRMEAIFSKEQVESRLAYIRQEELASKEEEPGDASV